MKIKSLVVFAVLATAIFGFSGIAKASCIDENFSQRTNAEQMQCLMSVIADLTHQIAVMQAAQQGTTPTGTTAANWCHTFTHNLGFRNSGTDDIWNLHTALSKEGFSSGADSINIYGEGTAAEVVQFQEKYASDVLTPLGLTHGSGFVGTTTRTKLNKLYGCSATTACTPNWQCTGWTDCINGIQYQSPVDTNNCGTQTGRIACPGTTQTCTPSTQPSITVTSPNGGEQWAPGTTHNITWTSNGVQTVNLSLNFGASGFYNIASNVSALSGSYSWTIPTDMTPAPQAYMVINSGSVASDYSNNSFSIGTALTCNSNLDCPALGVACSLSSCPVNKCIDHQCKIVDTATPSFTIISPNGGETWYLGEGQAVKWSSVNIPSTNSVKIVARKYDYDGSNRSYTDYILSESTPNNGVKNLESIRQLPEGIYQIQVKSNVNDVVISDWSDSEFKIGTETVTNPNCADGRVMTAAELNLAIAAGKVALTWNNSDASTNARIVNTTGCTFPAILMSYKQFSWGSDRLDSSRFGASSNDVQVSATGTTNISVPVTGSCLNIVALWYGHGIQQMHDADLVSTYGTPNTTAYTPFNEEAPSTSTHLCTTTATPSITAITIADLSGNTGITIAKDDFKLVVVHDQNGNTINPNIINDRIMTWTSSNPQVATVDPSGTVLAKASGQANISVSNGVLRSNNVIVTVPAPVATNPYCADGKTMTPTELKSAIDGGKFWTQWTSTPGQQVVAHVYNGTGCSVSLTLASYKSFQDNYTAGWQDTVQFIASSALTQIPGDGIIKTIGVEVSTCKTQVDLWYNQAPHTLSDAATNGYIVPNSTAYEVGAYMTDAAVCTSTVSSVSKVNALSSITDAIAKILQELAKIK